MHTLPIVFLDVVGPVMGAALFVMLVSLINESFGCLVFDALIAIWYWRRAPSSSLHLRRSLAVGALVLLSCSVATVVSAQSATPTRNASLPGTLVSTDWLQQHLGDPQVHIVASGSREEYDRGHVPGARFIAHDDTVDMRGGAHRLPSSDNAARVLAQAGVVDGMHVVLYGDSPMTTGWIYTVIASTGHAADVSLLDGSFELWRSEGREVSTSAPAAQSGRLTVHPVADDFVDAVWVREHLTSPSLKLLDVRTPGEWASGRLPGATLIQWQDLFADQRTWRWKSADAIRALFQAAGVAPGQEVVTYCAVGMRASLMAWAARSVGIPARVYTGSWQDWSRDATNPVVR